MEADQETTGSDVPEAETTFKTVFFCFCSVGCRCWFHQVCISDDITALDENADFWLCGCTTELPQKTKFFEGLSEAVKTEDTDKVECFP